MGYKSNLDKADRTQEAVDFPRSILFDNCSACNLRCSMCDHVNIKAYRKIQTMDMNLYKKMVDEIAHENPEARVWEIFFGEPFLCNNIYERVSYAKKAGLKDVVLNSNGVLMMPERAEAIINAGLDAMYVGIDAASKEVYDQIRVGGDFEKVVNNTLWYRDLLEKHGNGKQSIYVQFVVSRINEHEVDMFKGFWVKEGVNVKIRPKISWAGLVKADNLRSNADVERKPCYFLMQTMSICADGRVAICAVDPHCRVDCGSVGEKGIKAVWKGKLKEFRNMHKEGRWDELPDICRDCMDWQSGYADFIEPESNK